MAEEEFPQIPIVWVGAEDLPILMINSFLGQVEQDECILTLGQMTPPVVAGETREERLQMLRQVPYVPIKGVAKLGLTRQRLEELGEVIRQTLANYDQGHDR